MRSVRPRHNGLRTPLRNSPPECILLPMIAFDPKLAIALTVLLAILSIFWHFSRSRKVLDGWARDNGFEILHHEYRAFFRGPYFWRASKNQSVYYVQVRDQKGRVRSGVAVGFWACSPIRPT